LKRKKKEKDLQRQFGKSILNIAHDTKFPEKISHQQQARILRKLAPGKKLHLKL